MGDQIFYDRAVDKINTLCHLVPVIPLHATVGKFRVWSMLGELTCDKASLSAFIFGQIFFSMDEATH